MGRGPKQGRCVGQLVVRPCSTTGQPSLLPVLHGVPGERLRPFPRTTHVLPTAI